MADQLQRSVTTFRRSGSSGLVWDERLIFSDHPDPDKEEAGTKQEEPELAGELRHSRSVGSIGMITRSRSTGGCGRQALPFRAAVVQPATDPLSPELPRCCGLFTKSRSAKISGRR